MVQPPGNHLLFHLLFMSFNGLSVSDPPQAGLCSVLLHGAELAKPDLGRSSLRCRPAIQ